MRQIKKIVYLIFFVSGFSGSLSAQFYEYGQDPASLNWEKMESEHFKIVYPLEIKDIASKVLFILESRYEKNTAQLGNKPGKFPVVLHNHTVTSNGFVVWAPKRTEFFVSANPDPISQDRLFQLSLHEYRHIIQLDKMNTGFTKALTLLFGQQGIGPAAAMTPLWFLEGDAVYAETSLSGSGRGRSPEFEMGLKTHLLTDEKPWSFSKSYLGSYKDPVPDYYAYGYQMVSFGRKKYGEEIWSGALEYTGKRPFLLNPFWFYLRKETGGGKNTLYKNTIQYLHNHWEHQLEKRNPENYSSFNKNRKKYFTSYNYPVILEDNSVIAVKSGLEIIPRFVKVDSSGNEKIIHIPGILNSGRISCSQGKIIWDEYQPDIRWGLRSYSNIIEYNYHTSKKRILTVNSRLSSPSFSPSGDTIVAIENTSEGGFNLCFLSGLDGGTFTKIPSPGNIQILEPSWIPDSDRILTIGLNPDGKSLLLYDRSNNNWETILNATAINISNPVPSHNFIFLNAGFNGVDNIYALDPKTKQLFQLTNSRFGAFEPYISPDGSTMAFADYSQMGYNLVVKELDLKDAIPFQQGEITEQSFFNNKETLPGVHDISDFNPAPVSEPKAYRKAAHLFNIHSWSPFYFDYSDPDLEDPGLNPGFTILSQNLLSTAVSSLGYEYKQGESYLHTSFSWKGWLPVVEINHTWGGNPVVARIEDTDQPSRVETASRWSLNTYIPLAFYSGKWITGFYPSLRISFYNDYFYYLQNREYQKGIVYTEPSLYLYTFQRKALLDFQPRFGYILNLENISSPFEKEQRGSVNSVKTTLFLPGLIRGQGLKVKYESQNQNPERYPFGNLLTRIRGYELNSATQLNKFSLDYHMPLSYPDLSLEGLFYIKRIRANLFADFMEGKEITRVTMEGWEEQGFRQSSCGLEINLDYHLFRFLPVFSSGFRVSYRPEFGDADFEFLFDIVLDRF